MSQREYPYDPKYYAYDVQGKRRPSDELRELTSIMDNDEVHDLQHIESLIQACANQGEVKRVFLEVYGNFENREYAVNHHIRFNDATNQARVTKIEETVDEKHQRWLARLAEIEEQG